MVSIQNNDPNKTALYIRAANGQVADICTLKKYDGTEVFSIDKDGLWTIPPYNIPDVMADLILEAPSDFVDEDALVADVAGSQTYLDSIHAGLRYSDGLVTPPVNEHAGRRVNYVPVLSHRGGSFGAAYPGISEVLRGDFVQEWLESIGEWVQDPPDTPTTIPTCYVYDGLLTTFADLTAEIDSATVDDVVPFINGSADDAIYFGFPDANCQMLSIVCSTAGMTPGKGGAAVNWEYWGNGGWNILGWTDLNYCFLDAGEFTVTGTENPPSWEACEVDGTELFWIRCVQTSGAYTTVPLLAYAHYYQVIPPRRTYDIWHPIFEKLYINNNMGVVDPYVAPVDFAGSHSVFCLDKDDNFLWQVYGFGCASTLECWDELTGTWVEGGFGVPPVFRPGHRRGVRVTGIWGAGNMQRLMDIGWRADPENTGEVTDIRAYEDHYLEKNLRLTTPTLIEGNPQGGLYGAGDPNGGNIIMEGVGQTVDGRDVSQLILDNANPAVEQLTTKMVVIPDVVAVKNTTTNITVYGLTTISAANLSRKSAGCAIDVTYSFATNVLSIVNPSVGTDVTYDIIVIGA